MLSGPAARYTASLRPGRDSTCQIPCRDDESETAMTSLPIRDPVADYLITPENSALVLIDYQPTQFSSIRSMDPALLLKNIVTTVQTAKLFGLPIVHSTVNVSSGQNQPTV